jgi:hypothetical protein
MSHEVGGDFGHQIWIVVLVFGEDFGHQIADCKRCDC